MPAEKKSSQTHSFDLPQSELQRPRPTREVMLLFNRAIGSDREILRGIYDFCYPTHRWLFFFVDQNVRQLKAIEKRKTADGVIGKFGRPDLASAALELSMPVVNIHGGDPFPGLFQVGVDRYQQGAFAAEWFYKQGIPNFGFFGLEGEAFSEAQQKGFSEFLSAKNKRVFLWNPTVDYKEANPLVAPEKTIRWLISLPKPIALFCASDILANELSMFCLQAGLSIPQEIVVLASDNDDLLCAASLPALSSMRLPYREVGRRAAALLEEQFNSEKPIVRTELINRPDIVERQSTLIKHVADEAVEKAIQWMLDHATHGIDVLSAAKAAGVSLRSLELRFCRTIGHSPRKELNRIRLEAVKRILREQDKTLEEIAEDCSFSSGIYLSQFFRREAGMTPGEYRKAFRQRSTR